MFSFYNCVMFYLFAVITFRDNLSACYCLDFVVTLKYRSLHEGVPNELLYYLSSKHHRARFTCGHFDETHQFLILTDRLQRSMAALHSDEAPM